MCAPPTRRATWALLLALTLATLAARMWGLGFGAPVWEEPDPDIPAHVDLLRGDAPLGAVTAPEQQYPHLVARLVSALPRRPPASGPGAPRTIEAHLHAAAWSHVQVRRVVALVSALLVPLTFALARWFVSPRWALFAAALVATSLLHQSFSQQARPHGFAATLFVWALIADLRVARRGRWIDFAHAGLASALTLSALQSGLAVLLAGVGASAIAVAKRRANAWRLLAPVLIVAAALPVFYPFQFDGSAAVQDPGRPVDDESFRFGEHMVRPSEFDGSGFGVLARSLWNYDPVLSLLAVLGAAALLLSRNSPSSSSADGASSREAWFVVGAFALPYVLVCGVYQMTFERFALPLLPVLAVIAASGLELGLAMTRSSTSRSALSIAAWIALLFPAFVALRLAQLRSRPDTLGRAAQWVESNAPEATVWITPPLDVPLARRAEGLAVRGKAPKPGEGFTPWAAWQSLAPSLADDPAARDVRWLAPKPAQWADLGALVASLGQGYVLIEVYEQRTEHKQWVALREELRRSGELVQRFSPDRDPEATELELFFQLSDHFNQDGHLRWPHFAFRLTNAVSIGPVLELWRVAAREPR